MNLEIIGTSHIAKQSVNEIKKAFQDHKPEIVAVELDVQRAFALLHEEKNKLSLHHILQIGIKGYLFAKVGQYVQQKLGKVVGMIPGADMKAAMELAQKEKKQIEYIDQPIAITLRNFSKTLTWREKFRFVGDFFKGIIMPKKQIQKYGLKNFDLSKVPEKELIIKMVGGLKKDYPNVYKTLIEDRNRFMVKRLVKLMREHPHKKIIAVVGAGHVAGMKELLLKVDVLG